MTEIRIIGKASKIECRDLKFSSGNMGSNHVRALTMPIRTFWIQAKKDANFRFFQKVFKKDYSVLFMTG